MPPLPHPSQDDQLALVRSIQETFERSPMFRDARISDPRTGPEGEVGVEVRFGSTPALFRVVARSPERAYALLHELAVSLVGVERAYARGDRGQGEGGCNDTMDEIPSPEAWTAQAFE